MQVQVRPSNTNAFPLNALFIRGADVHQWLIELQQMNVSLEDSDCYPVPGAVANSLSGCLVILKREINFLHKHTYYQNIRHHIFIPENATLFPQLNTEEIDKLFPDAIYIFHTDIGWASLPEKVDWAQLLAFNETEAIAINAPKDGPFIPSAIKRLEVRALSPDEALEQLGNEMFPDNGRTMDKPLNLLEKIGLGLLRPLFNTGNSPTDEPSERSGIMKMLDNFTKLVTGKSNNWVDKLEENYNNLEERNKDEIQKLMDLFKRNPEEALKYAIPIDNTGSNRGGFLSGFNMMQRWSSFSLGGGGGFGYSGGGGNAILPDNTVRLLNEQYRRTAQDLIKNGDHEKAAFVYLKLLKDAPLAADTLENGGLYAEAAALHLKYNNNKKKAAECYAKGKMYSQAIELYKELNEHEVTGDLYMLISRREDAFEYYGMVIEAHQTAGKYIAASLLYRNKMNDVTSAQGMLLDGWKQNHDGFNCLNLYLNNIQDIAALEAEINRLYEQDVDDQKKETFIHILKHEHEKHETLRERTKEIAYEIVAEQSDNNPAIISTLGFFNKDENLMRDITRHKEKSRRPYYK
jgi:tetratricopeptide (TPR) repeat protein